MNVRRFLYFGYYVKKLNKPLFKKFLKYAKEKTGRSTISFCWDLLKCSIKYNISILEYFQFRFYECSEEEKKKWAGTGYMYEFQGYMNPKKYRDLLEDKIVFDKTYSQYIHHLVISLEDLQNDVRLREKILTNTSGKLVFKIKNGGCGKKVIIKSVSEYTVDTLVPFMVKLGYDLVEEYIQQHDEINRLAPTAVNTVRVITQLKEDKTVDIVGCRLRISVEGVVDNLAAGNIAAFINPETGVITGNGVYSDITKNEVEFHPITGVRISGFQIPYWKETIALVKEIACVDFRNRSIGWDIAITTTGPDLIEGNREWCKLLFQLPAKQGLKPILDKYYNNK